MFYSFILWVVIHPVSGKSKAGVGVIFEQGVVASSRGRSRPAVRRPPPQKLSRLAVLQHTQCSVAVTSGRVRLQSSQQGKIGGKEDVGGPSRQEIGWIIDSPPLRLDKSCLQFPVTYAQL